MTSANKWLIFGGLLSVLNLGWFLAERLDAAPSDIRGSGNVAVASYTTTKGSYILWSSGRITDAESGKDVAPPYSPASGFARAAVERGAPVGAPRVAVDYVQNAEGTYTLFGDGSVQKADDEGASAPAGGSAEIKFGIALSNSMPPIEYGIDMPDNLQSARFYSLKEPFEEGGVVIMPMEADGLPDPLSAGTVTAVSIGPDGKPIFGGKSPVTRGGGPMKWTGTWIVAIGK